MKYGPDKDHQSVLKVVALNFVYALASAVKRHWWLPNNDGKRP
jgi:hypothetical protein